MGKKASTRSRAAARKAPERHRRRSSPGQHDHLAAFDGACRDLVVAGGRAALASGDPLQAEGWATHVLGLLSELPLIGEADPAAAIGARLVSVADRRRSLDGQVCLRALAAVAPGPLGARAARAAAAGARSLKEPGWFATIGAARPTGAWRASDIWGDRDSIMVGFSYPGGAEHTLLVLVDHPLGGIAKDAAVLESPLAAVMGVSDHDDPSIVLVSEPVEVAAAQVIEAMGRTARMVGAPVDDDFRDVAALLRARFAPLATSVPSEGPLDAEGREDLVRAFLASPKARLTRRTLGRGSCSTRSSNTGVIRARAIHFAGAAPPRRSFSTRSPAGSPLSTPRSDAPPRSCGHGCHGPPAVPDGPLSQPRRRSGSST